MEYNLKGCAITNCADCRKKINKHINGRCIDCHEDHVAREVMQQLHDDEYRQSLLQHMGVR